MPTTDVAPSTTNATDPDAAPATPDFGPANRLVCRECGAAYDLGAAYACVECFGPLEVGYDFSGVSRALIESGPQNMWRYSCLLPVASYAGTERNLNPGLTHLVRADNLAKALGMTGTLWVKDDSGNPTHSFKDRVVAVAQSAARRLGLGTIACASTGNLANAVAAAAARAGMDSVVVIPSNLEDGKVLTTAAYGGILLAVDGNYDDVNRLCSELIGDPLTADWGFVNVNLRPYYAEGSKTVGYEIAEQLGWRLPEQVVAPIASGSLLTKVDKAFRELASLGLVEDSAYRVFGAQATGCSPVSAAFRAGHDVVRPVKPTRSRSRSRSGTPPTARTRSTSCVAPAARSRTCPTPRSSRASGCSPRPRGSSRRPPAASSSRHCARCSRAASSTPRGRRSSSTPVTASRPSTRSPTHVGPTATIAHDVDEVTRVLAEHHARLALEANLAAQA